MVTTEAAPPVQLSFDLDSDPTDQADVDGRPEVGVDLPVQLYVTVDADSLSPSAHHPHIPTDVALLLPASSWARKGMPGPVVPAGNPLAADCGGFVAGRRAAGTTPTFDVAGDPDDPGGARQLFRFSPDDYLDWLASWQPARPEWAATLDLPVEAQLAPTVSEVRARQVWATKQAADLWARWIGRTGGGAATPDDPLSQVTLIPTVQGRDPRGPGGYAEHWASMTGLVSRMWDVADATGRGGAFRVGIGSLCARTDAEEIASIVEEVATCAQTTLGRVPTFHLWGTKSRALSSGQVQLLPGLSADTAAWNGRFGRAIDVANRERAGLGLTQRAYGYRIALPRYLKRLAAHLTADT